MFSIVWHRVYIAIALLVTMTLGFQSLSMLTVDSSHSVMYGLYAMGSATIGFWLTLRWLYLEQLWERSQVLLVPKNAPQPFKHIVRKSLNKVLSRRVFRNELLNVLNKKGAFKSFNLGGVPVMVLDIAFPSAWANHTYLHCAMGWIVASMPMHIVCRHIERTGSRLVFHFVNRDKQQNMNTLNDAFAAWHQNVQRLFLFNIPNCSVQNIDRVPARINQQQTNKAPLPIVPNTAFDERVLLNKEKLRLHIGFNGNYYYTYFEDKESSLVKGRREYATWEALWSVWNHFGEVQAAFIRPSV